MPLMACMADGKAGWKYGATGTCHTGAGAKARAEAEAQKLRVALDVAKADEEQRLVYGWFSVVEAGGQPVVDSQGDVIAPDELQKAAHEYLSRSRTAGDMHQIEVGELVESVVLTADVQAALGIDLGKVGWFGALKIADDAAWAEVKKGARPMFSIGGRGVRQEIAA